MKKRRDDKFSLGTCYIASDGLCLVEFRVNKPFSDNLPSVYTSFQTFSPPPPPTLVCVSTKGKNKKGKFKMLCVVKEMRGGSIWWTPREEKKVHHLWLGGGGGHQFSFDFVCVRLGGVDTILWLFGKCVDESDIKIREGRNSTWRRFFVDQCLIFSFLPPIHSAPLNLSLKGGYVYIDSKSTTNASSLSKYI
jgi:hypothetical protein